jgi:hypothetical protein
MEVEAYYGDGDGDTCLAPAAGDGNDDNKKQMMMCWFINKAHRADRPEEETAPFLHKKNALFFTTPNLPLGIIIMVMMMAMKTHGPSFAATCIKTRKKTMVAWITVC